MTGIRCSAFRKGVGLVSSSKYLTIADRPAPCAVAGLFLLQPVAFGAKTVDLVQHPVEQRLGGGAGYSCPLELPNLTALALDLMAHALDMSGIPP